jgi:hypothetical protein
MKIINFMGGLLLAIPLNSSEIVNPPDKSNPQVVVQTKKVEVKTSKLVRALIQVESSGNDSCVGDKHMIIPSIGCLQIRPIMVREVNRILKIQQSNKRFRYKDRWSRNKSIEMFNIWKDHYHSESSDEVIARCWNGGPRGWEKKSTIKYWNKVKKYL